MYFMSLTLTASPENSFTKLSCYAVKSSAVNTEDFFHWKRLHSLTSPNTGGKILLFRLFSAFDNNTWIGSLFCLCTTALSRLTQGKTINTLTTFGWGKQGQCLHLSFEGLQEHEWSKSESTEIYTWKWKTPSSWYPALLCICQQILHTDCPPTAHMREQFLWAPSYFFLPKSVTILKTSLQAFLK